MRKLLIVLTGALVASLAIPAVASAGEGPKEDDKIAAQRDSDGRRSGYRGDRSEDDYRFRRDRRQPYGYYRDSYERAGYSEDDYRYRRDRRQPYGYYRDSYERSHYYGDPGYDRRARTRQQECYDAYYYDPSFYDRYCRAGYDGDYRYRSRR
ncbi:MAG: hypothetical protein AB1679_16640 [Actinomycetota bacterium]|jgi:hypothetical protein